MQILVHNLSAGKFEIIDGEETLQATLQKCKELNEEKIKHYPITEKEN